MSDKTETKKVEKKDKKEKDKPIKKAMDEEEVKLVKRFGMGPYA